MFYYVINDNIFFSGKDKEMVVKVISSPHEIGKRKVKREIVCSDNRRTFQIYER